MKTLFKAFAVFALLAIVAWAPGTLWAAEIRFGERSTVSSNEQIGGDAYVIGGSVSSGGAVAEDLAAVGGTVVISGPVGGDAFVAGGNITISSNLPDDLRVAGGSIVIQGSVGDDLIAGGGDIFVGGAGVGGDVIIGAGNLQLNAPVAGSVRIGAGTVYINGPVGGNVEVKVAEKLTLGPSAVISGNLTYRARSEAEFQEGARVLGSTQFTPFTRDIQKDKRIFAFVVGSVFSIGRFLALLAGALLMGLLLRKYALRLVEHAASRPRGELGRGLLAFAVIPVSSVLLLVTLVGIPLGILGLLSFVVLMLFTWIMTPLVFGSMLNRILFKRGHHDVTWKTILLGVVGYSALGIIPWLGCIAQFLLMLTTLGAIIRIKMDVTKDWR